MTDLARALRELSHECGKLALDGGAQFRIDNPEFMDALQYAWEVLSVYSIEAMAPSEPGSSGYSGDRS